MVLFHYALVDDLISQEEFERRVEEKIDECGDLLDEPTAAMLVVDALGRQHVKVKQLLGKSSLFCFFAKVIDKTEPKEFDRKDSEKGWVATILAGDETGTTRIVLWDERAGWSARSPSATYWRLSGGTRQTAHGRSMPLPSGK